MTLRKTVSALAFALVSATSIVAAHAEDSEFSISGSGGFVSDYRFRGVSQTAKNFALQGNINLNHSSGVYVGAWGSNIDDKWFPGSELETDLYAGWSGAIGSSGFTFDGGLLMYTYPGAADTNFLEPYASVSYDIGPVTTKLGAAYVFSGQSNFAASEEDSLYVFADANVAFADTPFSLQAHLGHEDGVYWPKGKTDWKLGVTYKFLEKVDLSVSYVDTNRTVLSGNHKLGGAGVVFGAMVSF